MRKTWEGNRPTEEDFTLSKEPKEKIPDGEQKKGRKAGLSKERPEQNIPPSKTPSGEQRRTDGEKLLRGG